VDAAVGPDGFCPFANFDHIRDPYQFLGQSGLPLKMRSNSGIEVSSRIGNLWDRLAKAQAQGHRIAA
jgi:hypothetical protein